MSRVFFILTSISTSSPIFVQCMTIKGDFAQRISSNIIAVKCNLKELTTRSTCLVISLVSSIFYMSVQQDSMCSWTQVHCSIVVFRLLVCVFMSVSVSSGAWGAPIIGCPLLSPLPLPLFCQCDGCLLSFPSAWELMAGLPGFASQGSSLHLGAGCQ